MTQKIRKNSKRAEFVVRIGPELMELIGEIQKSIRDITYGVVGDSVWEAGEIVAKKYKGNI